MGASRRWRLVCLLRGRAGSHSLDRLAGLLEALSKALSGEMMNTAVRQCCTHAPVSQAGGHQHLLRLGLTDSEPYSSLHALKGADAVA